MNYVSRQFFLSILLWSVLGLFSGNVLAQEKSKQVRVNTMPDTAVITKEIKAANMLLKKDSTKGLQLLSEWREKSRENGFSYGIALVDFYLAGFYSTTQLEKSIALFKQCIIQGASSIKGIRMIPSACHNLSLVYKRQGHYGEAAQIMFYARQLAEKLPDFNKETLAQIYNGVAEFYYQQGRTDKALECMTHAQKLALATNNQDLAASIYLNKGGVFSQQKNWDSAFAMYSKASVLVKKYQLTRHEYYINANLGDTYLEKGDIDKAIVTLEEAIQFKKKHPEFSFQNGAMLALANAYFRQHNYAKTLSILKEVEANNNDAITLQKLHKSYADLYAAENDFKKAYTHQLLYEQFYDSTSGQKIAETVSDLEYRYKSAQVDKELVQKEMLLKDQDYLILQQKNTLHTKNIWMVSSFLILITMSVLFFSLYKSNKRKARIAQLQAVMQGESQERARIARELHDGVGGMLASIKMHLSAARNKSDGYLSDDMEHIMKMVTDTAAEVRKTAHNLMPENLLKYTLSQALRIYCDGLCSDQFQVSLQFYGDLDQLDQSLSLSLYRIIQELLQNIIKHSGASAAAIQIREHEDTISIMVEDDGKGFNMETVKKGLGLQNIYSRVEALQGHISIESSVGMGTTAYIEVKLQQLKKVAQL